MNVFIQFIGVVIAADVNMELEETDKRFGLMIVANATAFFACIFISYKEASNNTGKLNVSCLFMIFLPFLLLDGVALGICIGSNATLGRGMPDYVANEGLLFSRRLPNVQDNGFTSQGFIEETLIRDVQPDGMVAFTEVWMYAYMEVTHF